MTVNRYEFWKGMYLSKSLRCLMLSLSSGTLVKLSLDSPLLNYLHKVCCKKGILGVSSAKSK